MICLSLCLLARVNKQPLAKQCQESTIVLGCVCRTRGDGGSLAALNELTTSAGLGDAV